MDENNLIVKNEDAIKKVIAMGSEFVGNLGGATLAALSKSGWGIVAGAAAKPLIKNVFENIGKNLLEMKLGSRERVRVGAAYTIAMNKIYENIKDGKKYAEIEDRCASMNNRPIHEELLEGVLLCARDEHEENKIEFMGYLYGNIPFVRMTRSRANYLIKLASQLSFRQLRIISIFAIISSYNLDEKLIARLNLLKDDISDPIGKKPTKDVLSEALEMGRNGILDTRSNPEGSLSSTSLDELGRSLYDLMELFKIPEEYLVETAHEMAVDSLLKINVIHNKK